MIFKVFRCPEQIFTSNLFLEDLAGLYKLMDVVKRSNFSFR